jgi:hypothetical protein
MKNYLLLNFVSMNIGEDVLKNGRKENLMKMKKNYMETI